MLRRMLRTEKRVAAAVAADGRRCFGKCIAIRRRVV